MWNPLKGAYGFLKPGGGYDAGVNGALGGAGHGLGWAAGKAGGGAAWGGKQALGGFQATMQSWSYFLQKTYGLIDPRVGSVVGAGPGLAGKLAGGGAKVLGFGAKGLLLLGLGAVAAVAAAGALMARFNPTAIARRVALKRRAASLKRPRHAAGRETGQPSPIVIVKSRSTLRTAIVLLLLFILLTPYTVEQLMNDGRRIIPGSMTGQAGVLPAGCSRTEQGGYLRLASDAGNALHTATTTALDPKQWQDRIAGAGHSVGRFFGAFRAGATEGLRLAAPPAGAAQVSATPCCGTTGSTQGVPASWPRTDSPATTAARAAQAAGFTGPDLLTAVAIAGAESGWSPTATHVNSNGSTDYGTWQINSVHSALLATGTWQAPLDNARMARSVWQGSGWRAWSTWNSGAYRAYLAQAQEALRPVLNTQGPFLPVDVPTVDPVALPASCTTPTGDPATPGPAVVETAIAFAEAQLGEPYVFGANGPDAWDCSGLVGAAYRAAGISLPGRPTTASLRTSSLPRIPQAQMLRGDLVMTSVGHVGLYLGNGRMIAAPHTGDMVKEQDVFSWYMALRPWSGKQT